MPNENNAELEFVPWFRQEFEAALAEQEIIQEAAQRDREFFNRAIIRPGEIVRIGNGQEVQIVAVADGGKFEPDKSGKRGEELFALILAGIREIYDVEAVIAGGAVRDLAAGFKGAPKDVDVFIPMSWEKFKKEAAQLGWATKPSKIATKPYKGTGTFSAERAQARVQGVLVDLVFCKEPLTPDKVENFPINAQKCVWTLREGMRISPAAKEDLDNKTFTINPKIKDKDFIKSLIEKIEGWKKKDVYKDWKIVEPDIKEWWEKE